jgi:hypothetical protein
MKLDDIKLSPEELCDVADIAKTNHKPQARAIADSATLKDLKKVNDELWNIWVSIPSQHVNGKQPSNIVCVVL